MNTPIAMDKTIKIYPALNCLETISAHEVAKKLRDAKERRIFIVDDKQKLIGVVTTTDLVYRALGENKCDMKAKDVMTSPVQHAEMNENLERIVEIMNSLKSVTCPVTDKGVLKGVVHYKDIVQHITHSLRNHGK